jgi:hypothetical protein
MLAAEATPCVGDGCLDACLARVDELLQTRHLQAVQNQYYQADANINIMVYRVDGDALGEPSKLWVPDEYLAYQEDTAAHQRIWEFFTGVIPLELRTLVDRVTIYTDGYGNSSAWVDSTPGSKEGWTIAFDILDTADPLDLIFTLVHEVGHLVTLNSTQIPPYDYSSNATATPGVCTQYTNYQGCSRESSYINQFYKQFWAGIMEEWKLLEKIHNPEEHDRQLAQFYDKHQSEFVSEYAATNMDEDLAESWTLFVLDPMPGGDDIADQKVRFFQDFPELVKAREHIIDGLCLYTR